MNDSPSTNGHDAAGRFTVGNSGGPGNPHARQVAKLRTTLVETVTPARLCRVAEALLRKAEAGDVAAAQVLMDRVLGKAKASVEIQDHRTIPAPVLLQQIALIVDRQPELRDMLAGHPSVAAKIEADHENG